MSGDLFGIALQRLQKKFIESSDTTTLWSGRDKMFSIRCKQNELEKKTNKQKIKFKNRSFADV